MKSKMHVSAITLVLAGVLAFWSCQKEEQVIRVNDPVKQLKTTAPDCATDCINPVSPVYFPFVSTLSDGPAATDKTTTVTVYNTLTDLVIEVVSNVETGTVKINDVVMNPNGIPGGQTTTFTFPLPSGWNACDPWPFKVEILGGGNPDVHEGTYYLIGACPVSCTPQDESAWSAGTRYVSKGNWATFTTWAAGKVSVIYAGQTINIGTATFSAVSSGNVTITINLTGGWYFRSVSENVKVQGYSVKPTTTPSPGLFANKATAAGTSFAITVPAAAYYGVHLDVELCQ